MGIGFARRFFVGCAVCLAACIGTAARAAEFRVYASPLGEYMIKVAPVLSECSGLMLEITAAAFRMANLQVDVAPELPWPRAQSTAMKESGAIIVLLARTPARESQWRWLSTVYTDKIYAYTMKGRPTYASYEEIQQKQPRVGVKIGTAAESIFNSMNVHVDAVPNADQNFMKLIADRIDVAVMQGMAVYPAIQSALARYEGPLLHSQISDFRRVLIEEVPLWIVTSQATPEADARRLQNALERFKKTRDYQAIVEKYEKKLLNIGQPG